jgi:tetratricopeptide (TPR) repeat protein
MLAATMALYGHIAVSFLSKLLVDVFLPGADEVTSAPRFGPAEALERLGDYQGALNEYHVLARIFPGRPEIMARIGGALEALTSYDEAALWFQRALDAQDRPHEATTLLWRLLDLLEHRQQRPDLAAQACEALLARFPDLPDAGSVELRRKRLVDAQRPPEQPAVVPSRPALVRLDEEPIAPDSQNRKPFS